MNPTLLTVLTASLLGSLHCAAMCGGLVGFAAGFSGRQDGAGRRIAAYHTARWMAYASLGALSGSLGHVINRAGVLADIADLAAILAGTLMIALGAQKALSLRAKPEVVRVGGLRQRGLTRVLSDMSGRLARVAHGMAPTQRAVVLGFVSAVLPCGWLWAFVATAAATGHPLDGALAMTAFWAGTLPALVSLGFGVDGIFSRLRRHVPAASAVLLVVAGVITVVHRFDGSKPSQTGLTAEVETTCHQR